MTKLIQILGALLGTIGGLILGLLLLVQADGLLDPGNRPAFLTAFVVASLIYEASWILRLFRTLT